MTDLNKNDNKPTLTFKKGAPLYVEGEFTLVDEHGEPVGPQGGRIALCRCGLSTNQPYCDGTHTRSGFDQ